MARIDLYAVAGRPALHSLSPALFRAAFEAQQIDAAYTRLAADSADEVMATSKAIGLSGINITSPFKEEILDLVDELHHDAATIGAVNTILFRNGISHGHNVDTAGIAAMCKGAGFTPKGSHVAVLGAGGAARAASFELKRAGADVSIVNRSTDRGESAAKAIGCSFVTLADARDEISRADAIFACWPQGAKPIEASWLGENTIVFDANYHGSGFAGLAKQAGCTYIDGRTWLLGQALECFELFTGIRAPEVAMQRALVHAPNIEQGHVILTGMMGSGKTKVGRELAGILDMKFVDTDAIIEERAGMSIANIFSNMGEAAFRGLEADVVVEALESTPSVISLGGGALTNSIVLDSIHEAGTVIWLWASPEKCVERAKDGSRPLLEVDDPLGAVKGLIDDRFDLYAKTSDLIVNTDERTPEAVTGRIADEMRMAWED